jgi:hypothetical protein
MKLMTLFIFLLSASNTFAQKLDNHSFKNGLSHPDLLPLHHFGIFSSRISGNFKQKPAAKSFQLLIKSANVFHPYVETYLPKDPAVREEQSQTIWYDRNFHFVDQQTTPADYMNIVVDAIIKEINLSYNTPINKQHDIAVSLQAYLFTKGNYPLSFFTSDNTIEWFHSHIAGGQDPFGRRYYGLNEIHYTYTDRNGQQLNIDSKHLYINSLQIDHHYYLTNKWQQKHIYVNLGTHLGFNLSAYNPSIDFGLSMNGLKKKQLKEDQELGYGFSLGVIRKNLINFDKSIDFGNNPFIGNFESMIEWTKYKDQGRFNTWGLHYQLQTRYFQKKEADYYQLVGDWDAIHAGWHNGISTLYNNLTCWSLIYTMGHQKYELSFYIQEDFLVHNAPDLQTGFSLKYHL